MKKLCLVVLAIFAAIPFCFAQQKTETARVVFFPFREAILASRIDGVVLENNLRLGQRFKQGDLLVKLDPTQYLIEIEKVKAQETESLALQRFAKDQLVVQEDLFKQNLASEIELKKAQLDVETAKTRLDAIRISLKDVQNQLSYCEIRAPFAGRLEEIATRSFETLRAGQPLMKIIDDSQLKAVMFVPVYLLKELKLGTEVTVTCTDTAMTLKGTVYEISPRADHRSGTIEIHVLVQNPEGKITAGMTGEFKYARAE